MSTLLAAPNPLAVLIRREIRGWLVSPLFWIGFVLAIATVLSTVVAEDDGTSSTMTMMGSAAGIGLIGMVVMARAAHRSDRTAHAAGAVSLGEAQRTLALAASIVVPFAAALVWFALAVVQYVVVPSQTWAVPFGPLSDAHVLTVMFATGVLPALTGPMFGLLLTRWVRVRGAVVIAVVAVVLVTIVLQGNFESTWSWHTVWPWVYWYGPLGWSATGDGTAHWVALPGSPYAWVVYLVALTGLGLLVSLFHDPEADRAQLRRWILVVGLIVLVALVLSMTLGLDQAVHNPVPGPAF